MLKCSFCGKTQKQVKKLIAAGNDNIHICDRCVSLSFDLLEKEKDKEPTRVDQIKKAFSDITPRKILDILDQHVIGQERAKKTVSVAIYNHCKRLLNTSNTKIQKSNLLFIGPTGVGKTLIAQVLSDLLEVPFIITDATTLTESGYSGDDTETLVERLLRHSNYDIPSTEIGIIYIDEIDKKAKRGEYTNISKDVSGEGVQQSLLKLMEGQKVFIPDRKNKTNGPPQLYEVDTENILFIVSGAFVGLDDIILQRIGKSRIGFNEKPNKKDIKNWEENLETRDLIKYGLIPEFVGRIPSVSVLHDLNKQQLVKVLKEPKNSITEQFKQLFQVENIELIFDTDSIKSIAEIAIKQELGARGLRKIVEQSLLETQFVLPELSSKGVKKIIVTKDTIMNKAQPLHIKSDVDN